MQINIFIWWFKYVHVKVEIIIGWGKNSSFTQLYPPNNILFDANNAKF